MPALPDSKNAEPDPVGGRGNVRTGRRSRIVAHLRSDRRHIQDRDIDRLRQNIMTKLNWKWAILRTLSMLRCELFPMKSVSCPKNAEEVTTEGGLDVIANRKELEPTIKRLQTSSIRVSLFVDPTLEQIDAAMSLAWKWSSCHRQTGERVFGKDRKTGAGKSASGGQSRFRIETASQRWARHQLH